MHRQTYQSHHGNQQRLHLWIIGILTIGICIACSFPGFTAREDKSQTLSTFPELPKNGEYYGDINPSDPGGWTYQGNCRYSEGLRLWLDNRVFIYSKTAVCGSSKDSGIETWQTIASGTDIDPYGQIFSKGIFYSSLQIINWRVGKGIPENKDIIIRGLVGKINTSLTEIEYCVIDDQGAAYDEPSLLYTFESACDNISKTIEIKRVD